MLDAILANRFLTYSEIQKDPSLNVHNCSESIISRDSRDMSELGLRNCRAQREICLTEANRIKRINFAHSFLNFDFQKVHFSDESYLSCYQSGLKFIKKFEGEILSDDQIIKKKNRLAHGQRVLVLAIISYNGPESLYFCESTINGDEYKEILSECLPDIPELYDADHLFMQDNSAVHICSKVQNWLNEEEIQMLQLLAQSPDLNSQRICVL